MQVGSPGNAGESEVCVQEASGVSEQCLCELRGQDWAEEGVSWEAGDRSRSSGVAVAPQGS